MLRQAAYDGGMPPDQVSVVLEKIEAALDLAQTGDLVVVMAYRIDRVWDALSERKERSSIITNTNGLVRTLPPAAGLQAERVTVVNS